MRATNKKNLFIGLTAGLACGSLALGLALAKPATLTPAYAETTETQAFSSTGTQLDAASAQIRFNATLTADEYAKYFDENGVAKEGTQTGMLILPLDVYEKIDGATGLTLDTYEAHDDVVQNVDTTNLWEVNENNAYEAWAKLDGKIIGEGNYNRALLYVCYVTDGTAENTQYTEAQKTSMSYEAMLAQSFDIDETYKTALADTYMLDYTVTFNDAYARTMTVEYGTKFSDMTSRDVSQLYWDANFTNQVAESDYITCDSTVYIKEENQNTEELLSFDYAVDKSKTTSYQENRGYSSRTWLDEFDGEQGVLKVEHVAAKWAPQFKLASLKQSLATNSEIYNEYDYLVVKLYVAHDETNYPCKWDSIQLFKNGSGLKINVTKYNAWVEYKFDLSKIKTYITENDDTPTESLQIVGMDSAFGTADYDKKGMFYVSEVKLEKYSINKDNYSTHVAIKGTGTVAWNEKANAVQLDYTSGTYVGATIKGMATVFGAEKIANYDYFTVEVYHPTTTEDPYSDTNVTVTNSAHMRYNGSGEAIVAIDLNYGRPTKMSGAWRTLIIPTEYLTDTIQVYEQQGTGAKSAQRMYIRFGELKKFDLDVNVSGGVKHNDSVAITATTSDGETATLNGVYATRCLNGNAITFVDVEYANGFGLGGEWWVVVTTADGSVGMKKIWVDFDVTVTGTAQVGETLIISPIAFADSDLETYQKYLKGGNKTDHAVALSVTDGNGNVVTINQASKNELPSFVAETAGIYTVTLTITYEGTAHVYTHQVEVA